MCSDIVSKLKTDKKAADSGSISFSASSDDNYGGGQNYAPQSYRQTERPYKQQNKQYRGPSYQVASSNIVRQEQPYVGQNPDVGFNAPAYLHQNDRQARHLDNQPASHSGGPTPNRRVLILRDADVERFLHRGIHWRTL